MNTEELKAILYESDSETDELDVVYIPPEVGEVTDEENIDDNLILEESVLDRDISGIFELHKHRKKDVGSRNKTCKKNKFVPDWTKTETPTYKTQPTSVENSCVETIILHYGGKTPYEIFQLFLDDTLLALIINYSKIYADSNNRHNFQMSVTDLRKFIGILYLSGYHTLSQQDLYWSMDEDKGAEFVKNAMRRNRFREIKRNIHVSDNSSLDKSDKFAKLQPLFAHVNNKFMQFGLFSHNLSIDEQMVPYFGRHSAKMFIRLKPVRFGFKIWCLCSSEGYLFQFRHYGGVSVEKTEHQIYTTLGERVVTNLLKVVEEPRHHRVFFDSFFTSYDLLVTLKARGFFATGTVRDTRTAKASLKDKKQMKKTSRGTYDCAFDPKNEITFIRWNDNNIVTIGTNHGFLQPLHKVKRFSRSEMKKIAIDQPNILMDYNKNMGGVDMHDNGVANYRIKIRGKKWWWPLFTNCLDSCLVNAWKIYNIANPKNKITQLEFKSSVVRCLMKCEATLQTHALGHGRRMSQPDDIRFDGHGHLVKKNNCGQRRRCSECHSTTTYMCGKCNIFLHSKCFLKHHLNEK